MVPVLPLPRLVFGAGVLRSVGDELSLLGVRRPLLVSDRGLERAGAIASAMRALPDTTVQHLDVPKHPTAAGADAAYSAYRNGGCDGVVALGGGSVLDTAKFVAALAGTNVEGALSLMGKPELLGPSIVPLIAIPTTVGTGSESSPVAALHPNATSLGIGTRSPFLVPRVAICDPDLVRTLPRRLIAATGIDALSHCIEGFFAEPVNPIVDALALDGLTRVFAHIRPALEPDGEDARAALLLAAFAGGAAIHKGLGPAHAVALACSDQDLHHGTLIAVALPLTVDLVARNVPAKAARIAAALDLKEPAELGSAVQALTRALDLPGSLRAAGYRAASIDEPVETMIRSPFNRTSPYAPTREEYTEIAQRLLA
jgi:alcohol dehydrogenase class IV